MKLIVLLLLLVHVISSLDIIPKNIEGTQDLKIGLTDKQLAIQRWLASLTFLNLEDAPDGDGWNDYLTLEENPSQVSNDALRYQLAHIAYSAVALGYYKTPAYMELTRNILKDSIERMINWKVWAYVKLYWSNEKTYPDPVIHQNIMYSGHLAAMIALYESITGDFTYTTNGWDFITEDGSIKIHYTAPELMQVIYDQEESDYTGGVACEPNGRFIICNNFQKIGFTLYDKLHQTNYTDMGHKWREFIFREGLLPFWSSNGDRYLKIVQADYPPIRFWLPLGAAGNDAWGLSFMLPWMLNSDGNRDWVCQGWKLLHGTRMWRVDEFGFSYLSDEFVGHKFAFDDQFTTAFYPIVERQCLDWANSTNINEKTTSVYWHFEKSFGWRKSPRNDDVFDAYLYDTGKGFRIMETSMLLLSMIINANHTLWEIYNTPFYRAHNGEPILEHVDYPNVMVSYAEYFPSTSTLRFVVKSNDNNQCRKNQVLKCSNIFNTSFY
jgi:hypothetical protein